jgi:predicted RNA-binding protein YlxR (DUF448 family)
LGCGAREEQARLIRLVVGAQGDLKIDRSAEARGGYLHVARACWQAFLRRKSLHRAFRAEVSKDAKEELIRELMKRYGE